MARGWAWLAAAVVCTLAVNTVCATNAAASLVTVPLESDYHGAAWSVVLQVGTPAVKFGLYVDTGSSDLSLTKVGCTGCSPIGVAYNPEKSSTSAAVPCNGRLPYHTSANDKVLCSMCVDNTCADSVTYITGKLKQVTNFQLYEDTVRMGPLEGPTALGAFFNMTNRPHVSAHPRRSSPRASLLASQPAGLQDGIIGLGFTSRSVANAPNLVLSFAASGAIGASQFSMSLNATGGALTLGGLGPFITSPIEWTPVVKEGFWQVGVKEVTLGGTRLKSVPASYSLSILDTGTPTINLPNVPFASFVGSLLATCNTTSPLAGVCNVPKGSKSLLQGGCASLSPQDLARFPALSFHIGGASGGGDVEVTIPASRYLAAGWYACPSQGDHPYPMRGLTVVNEAGWTVLGGPVLQQYNVVYDFDGARVGWSAK